MRTLSIDIETYSPIDLGKCGVYKYAESPDFEILLFAYSVDGGEVHVVSLAEGECLPADVRDALTDDTVTKWAFNASFERVCLSRYLSDMGISLDPFADNHFSSEYLGLTRFLNPESWRCSMIWSAYMGFPLSLEGAGAALGLEKQKLSEGRDLIRYFCTPCKPTVANGRRIRNLPEHAPERWEAFKAYNRRDVEAELSIQVRLANYPVPDGIWEEYRLDQEINDCGVLLDMELVKNAIEADTRSRTELIQLMRELTELDNPNSVAQMKQWLADNGMETETLGKKAVAELRRSAPELAPDRPTLSRVLSLRQSLAKSSVRKYTAMENVVCADGRTRGLFQFYGANRTGRWCLSGDHEVLTPNGWVRLDEWLGGRIACWTKSGNRISFQDSNALCFDYAGEMLEVEDARISQLSTPDHKMCFKPRYDKPWAVGIVSEMFASRPCIPIAGVRDRQTPVSEWELRAVIMTQADGHYTADSALHFRFRKLRKIQRCKRLLRQCGIPFVTREYTDAVVIEVPHRCIPVWLRMFRGKTFGWWLLDEDPVVVLDELQHWDGCKSPKSPNSMQYSTTNQQNADVIQALAVTAGYTATKLKKRNNDVSELLIQSFIINIWFTPGEHAELRCKPKVVDFEGKVYCAETPTGFFLVRRNGKVWITGNSGRLLQPHNLPTTHLPDLEQARDLVKSGETAALEMLYDSVPEVLSELIRTAFVPKPGCKFIVADFSAIEARVIAWLAGETWRNEVFATHGKIYEASASQMFRVPIKKITKGSPLRQKGKIAELALGYGGSVGALKAMGALEMGLAEEELRPLVTAWRSANPNIVRFWWDVDRAAMKAVRGKTTTETHGIKFSFRSGMLFITLPSGRQLAYVKPRIGTNDFGSDCVTYMGIGTAKRWERLGSYGPKFVENIVQATSRDILAYAMQTFRHCSIVMHVHDEIVIEADRRMSTEVLCQQMSRTPPWAKGLLLRAEGFECEFYRKD